MKSLLFKTSVLQLLIAVLLASCNNIKPDNTDDITVNIELNNSFSAYLYLLRIEPNKSKIIDSVLIDNKTINFNIKPYQSPDLYLIRLSPKQSLMFVAERGQNINLTIDPNTIPLEYNIQNSLASILIKENNALINSSALAFDSIYLNYRKTKSAVDNQYLRQKTDSCLKAIQENLYINLKRNIENHPAELSSIVALYSRFTNSFIFNIELDSSLFYQVSDSCNYLFPENSHCISLKKSVDNAKNKIKNIEIKEQLLDKGNVFKDICLTKLDETNYCIYSNTAKYKIIYLWRSKDKAFWDINPKLRDLYSNYSRQELDIIGISAETDKLSWRNYCAMEKLNWTNLIAEPPQLELINPRGTYPKIYLLDKDFKIIAKNPNIDNIHNIIKNL